MHLLKASAFRNLFNLNSTIPVSLNLLLKRCKKAGACWTFDLQSQIGRHDIFFQVGAERATMLQGVMGVHKMSGHSDYVQRGSASLRLWCGSDVETCPPAVVRWVGVLVGCDGSSRCPEPCKTRFHLCALRSVLYSVRSDVRWSWDLELNVEGSWVVYSWQRLP